MNRNWIAGLAVVALLAGATGVSAAADGGALYGKKCASCHGADGSGKGGKNSLKGVGKKYDDKKLAEITFSSPPKGMPKVKLSADEQKAVLDYIKKF